MSRPSRYYLNQAHSAQENIQLIENFADFDPKQQIQATFADPEFEDLYQHGGHAPRIKAYFKRRPAMLEQLRKDYGLPNHEMALRYVLAHAIFHAHRSESGEKTVFGAFGEHGTYNLVPYDRAFVTACRILEPIVGSHAPKVALNAIRDILNKEHDTDNTLFGKAYFMTDLPRSAYESMVDYARDIFGLPKAPSYPSVDRLLGTGGYRWPHYDPEKIMQAHDLDAMLFDFDLIEDAVWMEGSPVQQNKLINHAFKLEYKPIYEAAVRGDKLAMHLAMYRAATQMVERRADQTKNDGGIFKITHVMQKQLAAGLAASALRRENYDFAKAQKTLNFWLKKSTQSFLEQQAEVRAASPEFWPINNVSKGVAYPQGAKIWGDNTIWKNSNRALKEYLYSDGVPAFDAYEERIDAVRNKERAVQSDLIRRLDKAELGEQELKKALEGKIKALEQEKQAISQSYQQLKEQYNALKSEHQDAMDMLSTGVDLAALRPAAKSEPASDRWSPSLQQA